MNNWTEVQSKVPNEEVYKLGIPILYAKIRAFECIKNIGLRIEMKTYYVSSPEQKILFAEKKKKMQLDFHDRLGLHVDKPRSGGVGNSNDGNTARRAFSEPEVFSEISGVDVRLISRLAVILEVLSCGYAIDVQAFKNYCTETWHLYVELYGWYWMPASIHKILIHGWAIIASFPIPIGWLSEESQESRNKDLRYIRLYCTRKMSWLECHEDLLHSLLVSSDPVTSSLRDIPEKSTRNFSHEALGLLADPSL